MVAQSKIITPKMIRELNYKDEELKKPKMSKEDLMNLIIKRKQSAIDIMLS